MTFKAITGDLTQSSNSIAGDLSQSKADFASHFENDNNQRILFSGKYGSGKTTFLKEYFNERKKEYNAFFISPVNYSVGSNDDIFEYIKFDIIRHIITENFIDLPSVEITKLNKLFFFAKENKGLIIKQLLKALLSINQPSGKIKAGNVSFEFDLSGKIIDSYEKLEEEFKEYSKTIDELNKTENEILGDYAKSFSNIKGSIYEEDLTTKTIQAYLKLISSIETKRKNVLIIDDLDRLDPDHIFRILNILSVHNDYLHQSSSNKFGFDKIIVVCDIDSIESIFHHRYGERADFNGYIDKFYSINIYRFSFKYAIENYCSLISDKLNLNSDTKRVLGQILDWLIQSNAITFRSLTPVKLIQEVKDIELHCLNIGTDRPNFMHGDLIKVRSSDFPFFSVLNILINVFGDFDILKKFHQRFQISSDHPEYLRNIALENLETPLVFFKSLFILSNFCQKYNNPNAYFDNRNGPDRQYPEYPFLDPFGKKCKINLLWSSANKYKGNNSYFKDASIEFKESSSNYRIEFLDVFQKISGILQFLETKQLLPKLFK